MSDSNDADNSVTMDNHNGAVDGQDVSGGAPVPAPEQEQRIIYPKQGGRLTPFTSERGRAIRLAALERNRERLRRSALAGLDIAAKDIADLPSPDRDGVLTAIFANHALNANDPAASGSVASARLVIDHAYPEPKRDRTGAEAAAVGVGQAIGAELARRILDALRRADDGE